MILEDCQHLFPSEMLPGKKLCIFFPKYEIGKYSFRECADISDVDCPIKMFKLGHMSEKKFKRLIELLQEVEEIKRKPRERYN